MTSLRFSLAAAVCLALPAAAEDLGLCNAAELCQQDQFLRIQIDDVRIRDSYVNVAITYTNLDPEPVDLTVYSIYLVATSATGERIELSTNRRHHFIGQGAQRSDAHSLKFNQPVGDEIDLILIFENPDSRYAFLGLGGPPRPVLTH